MKGAMLGVVRIDGYAADRVRLGRRAFGILFLLMSAADAAVFCRVEWRKGKGRRWRAQIARRIGVELRLAAIAAEIGVAAFVARSMLCRRGIDGHAANWVHSLARFAMPLRSVAAMGVSALGHDASFG